MLATDRIRTPHVGSLPRQHDLLDLTKARDEGEISRLRRRRVSQFRRSQIFAAHPPGFGCEVLTRVCGRNGGNFKSTALALYVVVFPGPLAESSP